MTTLLYPWTVTGWSDHWTNGGTGITKTSEPHTTEITDSVTAFGDPEIYMKGTELHSSRRDLSDFWEFHRARLDSQNTQEDRTRAGDDQS